MSNAIQKSMNAFWWGVRVETKEFIGWLGTSYVKGNIMVVWGLKI